MNISGSILSHDDVLFGMKPHPRGGKKIGHPASAEEGLTFDGAINFDDKGPEAGTMGIYPRKDHRNFFQGYI